MKSKKKNLKAFILAAITAAFFVPSTAYAQEGLDPVTAISNLTTFILNIVTAIGVIALIWGAVQLSLALKSQDASQKTSAMLFIAGGAIMVGVKFVLQAIGVSV